MWSKEVARIVANAFEPLHDWDLKLEHLAIQPSPVQDCPIYGEYGRPFLLLGGGSHQHESPLQNHSEPFQSFPTAR